MDLRLQQLRYFVALSEEHSFTRAARRVGITQPSLSEAIRELENTLQIQLFTRSSRFVELSRQGAELVETARHAIEAIDRFRLQAASLALQSASQPLRIGAPLYSACPSLELEIMERFAQENPSSPAIIVRRTVVDLLGLLESGDIDLTFILEPGKASELSFVKIAFVPFTLVVPARSPYARATSLPLGALTGLHIAGYEREGSPIIFDRLFEPLRAAGVIVDTVLENSILGMRRHCESHGSGMLVPEEWIKDMIADGTFSRLHITELALGLNLCVGRQRGPQSRGAQKFWELVCKEFSGIDVTAALDQ
jgi:DNA-binding transcriptional LysR family regulator